jgi:DNA-binding response OmpR family regulator
MNRILLVEDEPSFREALSLLLAAEGFEVTTASHGADGLRELERTVPDLIVTDYMMPFMNGLDMLKQVRASPRLIGIPILLLSSIDVPSRRIDSALYDTFLSKTCDIDLLLETIRGLLPRQP